jgi:hypothetical protein
VISTFPTVSVAAAGIEELYPGAVSLCRARVDAIETTAPPTRPRLLALTTIGMFR